MDADDKFRFDEEFTAEGARCVISGLMAGLYYLPPERLLRHQTGWGRRIRYKSYRQIDPTWTPLQLSAALEKSIEVLEVASIPRYHYDLTGNEFYGLFRIYRSKLGADVLKYWLDAALECSIVGQRSDAAGISVSNAGGYHSKVVSLSGNNGITGTEMGEVLGELVRLIEAHDHSEASSQPGVGNSSRPRHFNIDRDSESWVNISGHGAYNRLHTHEGASWSGALYLRQVPVDAAADVDHYGNLLLKPTAHRTESTYTLSDIEVSRLNLSKVDTKSEDVGNDYQKYLIDGELPDPEICDYISVAAERGSMLIMPSWLHHCVMPLAIKKEFRENEDVRRISLAFNINSSDENGIK
jgi:hypothetical protein